MNNITLKNGEQFPNIVRGLWQVSEGHQLHGINIKPEEVIKDAIHQGFNTFDCADIYVGAEDLLGRIRQEVRPECLRVHTKYVPDLDQLDHLDLSYTEKIIDRSLRRLKADCLDLVQFHWWDYQKPYYLEALRQLDQLKSKGKIKAIGLTNFDSRRLKEILDAGFDIQTIQLQASVIDKRSQTSMKALCESKGIKMLAYGTLLGGFLSSYWLNRPEPSDADLQNRSLYKYKLIIDDWGGWARFQSLLSLLSKIAENHFTTISQIAIQAVLQGGLVDAVIIGLSTREYQRKNKDLLQVGLLSEQELSQIMNWDCPLSGDIYELERSGKHAKLMKYHLNRE